MDIQEVSFMAVTEKPITEVMAEVYITDTLVVMCMEAMARQITEGMVAAYTTMSLADVHAVGTVVVMVVAEDALVTVGDVDVVNTHTEHICIQYIYVTYIDNNCIFKTEITTPNYKSSAEKSTL